MSKFNGKKLNIEIIGESHSSEMVCNVKGFPSFRFNDKELLLFLLRRKASNSVFSTKRIEDDLPVFSNVSNNTINGDFSFKILNNNVIDSDYDDLVGKPRPSHADLAWFFKDGVLNFNGGGRFSGRLTAPLCVIGGICKQYLELFGIKIEGYISSIGKVNGLSYKTSTIDFEEISNLREGFPSLSKKEDMLKLIEECRIKKDSIGGRIEVIINNMRKGIGDNLFDGLEGKISQLVYSVPAVKGVEFGAGFDFSKSYGSSMNDQIVSENGDIKLLSNNNGGINGGISNGENITIGVAIKPTPSIGIKQKTINLLTKQTEEIEIKGRHDSCIVPRAVPCIESAVAIAILDELL